ncbi:MAG: type II toxin-antitoxin system prevent-host-death family antitoxin [Streptosporangiaceae bacterium]
MTAILEEPSVPVRRVPIRELQQHAARVIRELAEAEEMAEITSRGEVVARLIPVSPAERAFAAMIARGEITSAESDRDISDIEPLPPRTDGISLSEVLMQMREEEPW